MASKPERLPVAPGLESNQQLELLVHTLEYARDAIIVIRAEDGTLLDRKSVV